MLNLLHREGFPTVIQAYGSSTTSERELPSRPSQASKQPGRCRLQPPVALRSTFNVVPMSTIAAGVTATYSVSVELDPSATNPHQGLAASVPLTWSIAE